MLAKSDGSFAIDFGRVTMTARVSRDQFRDLTAAIGLENTYIYGLDSSVSLVRVTWVIREDCPTYKMQSDRSKKRAREQRSKHAGDAGEPIQ